MGTVQFGLPYGISNKRGQIPRNEVFDILDTASKSGITILDTANAYGDSEEIIGEFIRQNRRKFNIISKLPQCKISEVKTIVRNSLKKLTIRSFYGYLFHDIKTYIKNPVIYELLKELKEKGIIGKIGFSLYSTQDLELILKKNIRFDIVQVPYSIFDQRFEKYFEFLAKKNIEIHVRSIFLQGLVFKNPETLPGYFNPIKGKLRILDKISGESGIPLVSLALGFVLLNQLIDKVIVGVDSLRNFREIIDSQNDMKRVRALYSKFISLKVRNNKILLPFNWKGFN